MEDSFFKRSKDLLVHSAFFSPSPPWVHYRPTTNPLHQPSRPVFLLVFLSLFFLSFSSSAFLRSSLQGCPKTPYYCVPFFLWHAAISEINIRVCWIKTWPPSWRKFSTRRCDFAKCTYSAARQTSSPPAFNRDDFAFSFAFFSFLNFVQRLWNDDWIWLNFLNNNSVFITIIQCIRRLIEKRIEVRLFEIVIYNCRTWVKIYFIHRTLYKWLYFRYLVVFFHIMCILWDFVL